MSTWGSKERDERGAAVVETALCVCFLVLPLVFATIAYAYMLSFRQSLSQAAAEGARAAAVAPAGTTKANAELVARQAIDDALDGLSDDLSCGTTSGVASANHLTCTFTWTDNCGTDGLGAAMKCLAVKVSYPYRDHSLLPTIPGLGFSLPQTLSYTATSQVG